MEISTHGGLLVPAEAVAAFVAAGARLARPGEFTRRAMLTGKLDLLQAEATADLIDAVLAAGDKSGYSYAYSPALLDGMGFYNGYVLNADPTVPGSTGTAYYFTDQTHVIRASVSGPATASDSPVAQ